MYNYRVSVEQFKNTHKTEKRILLKEEMALLTTPEVCQPGPCICYVMFSGCLVWALSLY